MNSIDPFGCGINITLPGNNCGNKKQVRKENKFHLKI
jgi:hypothetical protein